jgi:hypothetical protein
MKNERRTKREKEEETEWKGKKTRLRRINKSKGKNKPKPSETTAHAEVREAESSRGSLRSDRDVREQDAWPSWGGITTAPALEMPKVIHSCDPSRPFSLTDGDSAVPTTDIWKLQKKWKSWLVMRAQRGIRSKVRFFTDAAAAMSSQWLETVIGRWRIATWGPRLRSRLADDCKFSRNDRNRTVSVLCQAPGEVSLW